MSISLVPAEMIEKVAEHLSLDDIIACSMVNSEWRRAFDNDRIWKRYYTFHQNYFKKQVSNQRNHSKYFFGGCKSKKHIFHELQVEKNLVKEKYVLLPTNIGKFYCDNLLDVIDEVGNHWLFISCVKNDLFVESSHMIQVWNMNDYPIVHECITTPIGVTRRILNSQMRRIENKVYYSAHNVMIAFEFSRPEYKMKVLFQVRCPDFEGFIQKTALICKPNMVLGFVYTNIHAQQLITQPWVHVWGEDETLSFRNYSDNEVNEMRAQLANNHPRNNEEPFFVVHHGGYSDYVLLVYRRWTGFYSDFSLQAVLFNVKTLLYSTVVLIHRADLVYWELVSEVVVLFYLHRCSHLNNESQGPNLKCISVDGRWIYEPLIEVKKNCTHYHVLTANEGKEILVFHPDGEVTVFDVFEQQVVSKFRILRGDNIGTFVKNNLIIVQHQKSNKTVIAVWDFKQRKRLYNFDSLQLPSGFYRFTFTTSYRSPPKIFAIEEPEFSYCHSGIEGKIVMISFI